MVTVEWRTHGEAPPVSFDDLPVRRPTRPLRAAARIRMRLRCGWPSWSRPWPIGQRALVAGPPGAGATHLLREMTRGLIGGEERLIVALVDVRPEEVPEWDVSEQVEVHCRTQRPTAAGAGGACGAGARAGQAPGRAGRGRDRGARLDHASGPGLRARAQPIGERRAHARAARRRGRQALVRIGARHRRGIADAARHRPRGVGVRARDTSCTRRCSTRPARSCGSTRSSPRGACTRRSTRGARARWARRRCWPRTGAGRWTRCASVMRSLDPVEAWEFASARVREAAVARYANLPEPGGSGQRSYATGFQEGSGDSSISSESRSGCT